MVQRNWKTILIGAPKLLKHQFGLCARIDENERHLRGFYGVIHFRHSEATGMTRPRNPLL